MKFQFIARCDEQMIPLEVDLPYKPGKQAQRARRVAFGQLLGLLDGIAAQVDASGEERLVADIDGQTWVIGEGGGAPVGHGKV